MKAEQNSLTGQLDIIDALISQNQMGSALKELKKVSKRAYDSWSYIGIYKRYIQIGQEDFAEETLKKALKKNDQNLELLAVYSNFLIRQNRLEDAKKYAEKLKGTKYASLYSELILKDSLATSKEQGNFAFYNNQDFYQIYLDAYSGSKNPIWLRNAAICQLSQGQYNQAALLNPNVYAEADDAYFWALLLYDSGKYFDSVQALEISENYLCDYQNNLQKSEIFKTSLVQIAALKSDAYMAISDFESAEQARSKVVLNPDSVVSNSVDENLLSVILVNSAIYAQNQGLDDKCADLLFYCVNRWPDFVPTLILYSDFAYRSNQERKEDSETLALRRYGVKTLEMESYDNRRKIPLSDALYRIDQSLKRQNDPYLSIARLDLKYKTDTTLTQKDKNRDLWNLLEDNYIEGQKYHSLLVQYALTFLLNTKQYEDAWNLFYKYVQNLSSYDTKRDFWEQFIENLRFYDLPLVELGGWFAADQKLSDETLRIFEYCVYESGGLLEEGLLSPLVSTASCMNLADIYYSLGYKDKALDLYGRTAGREISNSRRSEIFYRIGCIYAASGDTKNALRSLDYAVSLYPENERASLLKEKLKTN